MKVGHCQAPNLADIAQLVERTLGKGEVPSSNPGISTSFKVLFDCHSVVEPPDSMPNSEVKRTRADDSVADAM